MVTYGFYGLFGVLGLANLYAGRWGVAVFYLVLIGISVYFDRRMARDTKAHEARMAASAAEHEKLMARLHESTERMKAEHRQFMAEHYVCQVVVKRSDFLPLTEDREACLRAEFDEAASQCLHNLRG